MPLYDHISNYYMTVPWSIIYVYKLMYQQYSFMNIRENLYNIFMYIYIYMYCKNNSVDMSSQNFWKFKALRKF